MLTTLGWLHAIRPKLARKAIQGTRQRIWHILNLTLLISKATWQIESTRLTTGRYSHRDNLKYQFNGLSVDTDCKVRGIVESHNPTRSFKRKRQDPLSNSSKSEEDYDHNHTMGKRPHLANGIIIGSPLDYDLQEHITEVDGAVSDAAKELDLL